MNFKTKPSIPEAALPAEGVLKDYLIYTEPTTDAPLAYHLFVGLTIIGVSLGNRVYLPFGAQRIYPNLYIALIGSSGFSRKTTAIGTGREILEDFSKAFVLPDEFTPERLYLRLSQNPVGLLTWSEFGSALANFERPYMRGTKEFLTDLYDCRKTYTRESKKAGKLVIDSPAISILTASTPDWLRRQMKEEDIRAGFFPRFLFVPAQPKDISVPIPPPANMEQKEKVIKGLESLKDLEGEVDISKVEGIYFKFYDELRKQELSLDEDDILGCFYNRIDKYCLKLAIIYSASSGNGLKVDAGSMDRAIALTRFLLEAVRYFYSFELSITPEMRIKERVYRVITKKPGIDYSTLMRNSNTDKNELKRALAALFDEGRIEKGGESGKDYYPVGNS